jgi:hypothetical protein
MKPIFMFFMGIGETQSNVRIRERMGETKELLEKEIGEDFKILVFATKGETRVQIYPPGIYLEDLSEDLIKTLARKSLFKNLRIKFEKEDLTEI